VKYEAQRRIKRKLGSIPKSLQNISFKYHSDERCISSVKGKHQCFSIVHDDKLLSEKHQLEFVFCPLFSELKKVEFLNTLEKKGFTIGKSWFE
jgi:hypothetical protein